MGDGLRVVLQPQQMPDCHRAVAELFGCIMSEYQYYEFQAIDRALSAAEIDQLRACSSRAHITPTSFVVDYSWGHFKGNEDAWMANYFDAFLYLANWGTHILKLRLPKRRLTPAQVRVYCQEGHQASVSVWEVSDKLIITFVSDTEEGEDWVEAEGYLSSLISVRAELAQGDLRALYLGWLLQLQAEEIDDEEPEPPVPPGLGQLSASLESLVEFLRIDRDLLAVAAEASAPLGDARLDRDQVLAWVSGLAVAEKERLLADFIIDHDDTSLLELRQRLYAQHTHGHATAKPARTAGQLLNAAERHTEERQRRLAEQQAQERAQREREAARARQRHLDSLVGRETALWAEIETLIDTKQPKNYDRAVQLLIDLRDLAVQGEHHAFHSRINALRQAHTRKPSLMARFKKAGLCNETEHH